MPPVYAFPLLIPAFVGLRWALESASRREAFRDGWWFGFGFFVAGLYWICISLLTDPSKFLWLLPFALLGLPAVLAVYIGIFALLIQILAGRGVWGAALFASVWTVIEYVRSVLFSGFPWNLIGYSWTMSDAAMQMAAVTGVYGLSWLTVFAASLPSGMAQETGLVRARRITLASWAVIILIVVAGALRLQLADILPSDKQPAPGVVLRLVQANIAQHHKWDPKLQMQGLKAHLDLTRSPGFEDATHVIWPETAVPFALSADSVLLGLLQQATPEEGVLLTGTLRAEGDKENFRVWNSVLAIHREQGIVAGYDKAKLVPFGEFVPLRNYLPDWLTTPAAGMDFARGPGPVTLQLPGLPPVSPLICYEVIFPSLAVTKDGERPQWLLNVTNDAWFGISSGPYQHFAMARVRAVEQGLPLVRVANTGISAVTDAYGRVEAELGLNEHGVIDANLPQALGPTPYSRFGEVPVLLVIFINIVLALFRKRQVFH